LHLSEILGLVGRRVTVEGVASRDTADRIEHFLVSKITPAEYPGDPADFFTYDVEAEMSSVKPIPDLDEFRIADLTEREAEDFWGALTE